MGMVSALGDGPQAIARSIQQEWVRFRYSAFDPEVVVAPIDDFDVRAYTGRFKNLRYLNRGAAMAVAAAMRALQDTGLTASQRETAGLFVGSGPNLDLGGECPCIHDGHLEPEKLAALWILRFLPNTAASAIAQLTGLRGENLTVGNACAASLQAIGEAFRKIKDGYLDLALAGGGDSRLNPGGVLAYKKAQALYGGTREPHEASRPFDQARQGFVPGEGGAFFLLESAEFAAARKAPILAEVCGYGATMDGHTMTAPQPDGRWAEKAVRSAMADAGLAAEQIQMISAHGTGTPLNDAVEAGMIQRIFGDQQPVVLAFKSWVGHLASACGAVELALCLSVWQTGVWPSIRNLDVPCLEGLNYFRAGTDAAAGRTLIQNFGFGGQNAALVISPWQP